MVGATCSMLCFKRNNLLSHTKSAFRDTARHIAVDSFATHYVHSTRHATHRQIKEASQTPLYASMIHRPNSWSLYRQHNMLIAFFNIQSWSLIIFSEFNIAANERKRVDTRVWGGKVITKGHELCSVYHPYHTWRKMTDQRFSERFHNQTTTTKSQPNR